MNMNKTVKILCGLVATAISATTLAETYNKELELSYSDQKNGDRFNVYGRYYFDDVDSSVGPLAEAGFLSQAPWISLKTDHFTGNSDITRIKNLQNNEIRGSWYFENLFVTLGLGKQQATRTDSPQDALVEQQLAKIGYYINDSTALTLSKFKRKFTIAGSDRPPTTEDEIEIRAKHLLSFGDQHLALSAGKSENSPFDGVDFVEVEARVTYYPIRDLGFSFSWKDKKFPDLEAALSLVQSGNLTRTIGAEYFINSNISVDVGITRGDRRSHTLSITSRF